MRDTSKKEKTLSHEYKTVQKKILKALEDSIHLIQITEAKDLIRNHSDKAMYREVYSKYLRIVQD